MTTKKNKVLMKYNKWTGAVNMRYSTINQSIALNLNYASKKFAALTLVSFNDFGFKNGKKKITMQIFLENVHFMLRQ
jgi:hemoglobin/transferrin/lactoferrin receptor protein